MPSGASPPPPPAPSHFAAGDGRAAAAGARRAAERFSDRAAEWCSESAAAVEGGDWATGLLPPRSGQVWEDEGVSEGDWEDRPEQCEPDALRCPPFEDRDGRFVLQEELGEDEPLSPRGGPPSMGIGGPQC